jgi:predicted GNAT superfamily acetyltransferase
VTGLQKILALNNAHAVETGPLDMPALEHMIANAFFSITRQDECLLLCFDQDADYVSTNFQWFKARFDRFVYVDRIIIAADARGRGLARQCYDELIQLAVAAQHTRIVCEINIDPPNPVSAGFHRRLGFGAIGHAVLDNGKTVSYQEKRI